jgi:hypothetical protein
MSAEEGRAGEAEGEEGSSRRISTALRMARAQSF